MTETNPTGTTDGTAASTADTPTTADTATTADSPTVTTADTTADAARHARKVREGVVTSASMDKTIVVTIVDRVRHAKYNKFILRNKKLYAHDDANDAGVGDKVRLMETRPLSKNKRWRLVEILERAR